MSALLERLPHGSAPALEAGARVWSHDALQREIDGWRESLSRSRGGGLNDLLSMESGL
mgnify:CR=1 FL=1